MKSVNHIHQGCFAGTGAIVRLPQSLQWRQSWLDSVSNHQPHHCTQPLIRAQIKRTSKLRLTGLCAWNSPVTGECPRTMASYAENVSIWRRHHGAWSKPMMDMVKISQCITFNKGNKAKTVCICLGIYCIWDRTCNYFPQYLWDVITWPCTWYLLLTPSELWNQEDIPSVLFGKISIIDQNVLETVSENHANLAENMKRLVSTRPPLLAALFINNV